MIKKLTAALFLFLIGIGIVTAQMRITGQIVDEKGEPIAGATIQIKNNKKLGTSSDISGNFVISVPKNSILIISYIGYKTQEVKAVPKLKIIMRATHKVLQEVVITGMQKMDKRLFTGATSKLDAGKVKLDGIPDISRALEGRSAGVSIQNVSGTFGTAPKIRVRGATSIYGSSRPL